ncbi:MAG: SH3 domain-containing protein [Anaerolineae bacterium]
MRRFLPIILIFMMLSLSSIWAHIPNAEAQNNEPWAALFYPTTTFDSPTFLITYETPGLALNWGAGAPTDPVDGLPLPGIPANNFAVRFASTALFNTGFYEFTVIADGGVRLIVNNETLIDDIGNTGLTTFTVSTFISSGARTIILDYVEYTGNAVIELDWEDITDETDGAGNRPEDDAPNVVTAEVEGVNGLALRTGPYLGASLVAVLRPGRTYTVVAQNNTEGAFTWYRLITNEAGQTGWASGRYLDVNFRNLTTYSCTVTPELALSVAGRIVDPTQQIVCTNAVLGALNSVGIDGVIPSASIENVEQACLTLFEPNAPVSTVTSFINNTRPIFDGSDQCTVNNTPGLSVPEETSVFETLITLPDTGVTISPRSVLNIRVRPGTRVAVAGQIPWGAEAQLLARTVEAGDDHWYLVRYAGIVGWVDASFVNVRGNIADVPIY